MLALRAYAAYAKRWRAAFSFLFCNVELLGEKKNN